MEDEIFRRKVVDDILKYLDSKEAIVIYGARQVGKTSLLKYLIKNNIRENVFYFDLELKELLDLCNKGPEEVYKYLLQRGADEKNRIFLIIDEIQYIKDPTNLIKILHDHYPNLKLLVSGSSTFEIKKKFKQSLAGRTITFEIYPLSFEEFLVFKGNKYKLLESNSEPINKELVLLAEEYIKFGGYPQVVLENSEEKKQSYLSQIINTYVRKDIRDIGNIRDVDSFNKLLEVLASQSGQLLNVLELSNTLGINRVTVLEYLNLLENTFIIRMVRPFHRNLRSELTKNPKVFILDTGMMHMLWLKDFPRVILGNSFETFIFLELMKSGKKVNFWRTTNKQEVDFIVSDKKLYSIEAKLNFKDSSTRGLKLFSEKYGSESIVTGLTGPKSGKYIWEIVKILEK